MKCGSKQKQRLTKTFLPLINGFAHSPQFCVAPIFPVPTNFAILLYAYLRNYYMNKFTLQVKLYTAPKPVNANTICHTLHILIFVPNFVYRFSDSLGPTRYCNRKKGSSFGYQSVPKFFALLSKDLSYFNMSKAVLITFDGLALMPEILAVPHGHGN